jgi:hypothetical protein
LPAPAVRVIIFLSISLFLVDSAPHKAITCSLNTELMKWKTEDKSNSTNFEGEAKSLEENYFFLRQGGREKHFERERFRI